MAISLETLPYLMATPKPVVLPWMGIEDMLKATSDSIEKNGFGNLVFLFTNDIKDSIYMIKNKTTCHHNGKYKYFYYNAIYRGVIANRRYNINTKVAQKNIYKDIKTNTEIDPHPPGLLNTTQARNCFFDLSVYNQIYHKITENFTSAKKMTLFWNYFSSIWNSTQCERYQKKWVLINVDMFSDMSGPLSKKVDNPLFMIYYSLYKNFDFIKNINIEFVIYCKKHVLRVNPSKCTNKSYLIFQRELKKLTMRSTSFDTTPEEIDEEDQKEQVKDTIIQKYNFTGDTQDRSEITTISSISTDSVNKKQVKVDSSQINKKIEKKVTENIETAKKQLKEVGVSDTSKEATDYIQTKTEMEIENDKEIAQDMYKLIQINKVPVKPLSSARDAKMREKQESLTLGSISFAKINEMNSSKRAIPIKDISSSVHNVNKNMKQVKFANINKDYIENVMPQDIAKVFTSLNNKSMKLYVDDIQVEDTSDELNYKETYKVILRDESGQKHTVTVDIPKFLDNKFMYLGGNKKIIDKQNFLYPVVKTAPDTVQIVTNYNKIFIRRLGTKSVSTLERIMKLVQGNDECKKFFISGNNSATNKLYLTTIEYDEFSKVFTKFKTDNCTIFFNQKEANDYIDSHGIEIPENNIFMGFKDKKPIFINADTQTTEDGQTLCDLLITELPQNLQDAFNKTRSTKKLMYNTATIMSQAIPFIVLLIFWEGITSVVKKMGLKYYFSSKYPSTVKSNEAVIRFKDGYFVYQEDFGTSLLMNGMKVLDTENYNFVDYDTSEPYLPYFKKVYGKVNISNAIANYYDFMIDPITKEVLKDVNLPTDLIELCIYANSLLADESYTKENSQILSRIRSTEIIPAILYYALSDQYLLYKNGMGKNKISLPRDCVIKQLLALQTVEDYSTLNPVVELEKERAITSKGYKGINMDRAYTEEKRSYDKTMTGVMSMSTSPDGNCGINRFLTMEPTITSARGYVDLKYNNRKELKDINLFSPAELLYPLGNTRDDSIRTAMAEKQSKHVIPVKNSSPALISNGADEAIRFNLSSDFIINAEEDGVIIDYDEKSKILMVEYKSGKHRAIDLAPHIVKNGGGGFYLSNELVTNLKIGDKIKKDQCLAWHKDFFKNDSFNGTRMNVGVLEKVAIMSSYNTYNDSTVITHKLAADAETAMTFCKPVVIGKNSNIYDIRQVGDHVEIGDPLISFDVSFEDNDLNKFLAQLSDENKQIIEEGSVNLIKSKYAGRIVDIKIYSTVELDELSDSLKKIIKSYYNRVNHKKNFVGKYEPGNKSIVKCGLLLNETSGKIEPNIYGVIKGQKVQDSVLIEFYIEHGDIMGVGDKLAYFTALKSIIGEIIPEGYEPYSEFRPDEEVSSLIGPSAILKRQVPSILLTVLGNKVIVELKRKLEEIYKS